MSQNISNHSSESFIKDSKCYCALANLPSVMALSIFRDDEPDADTPLQTVCQSDISSKII